MNSAIKTRGTVVSPKVLFNFFDNVGEELALWPLIFAHASPETCALVEMW
jgi:hypothetical protein